MTKLDTPDVTALVIRRTIKATRERVFAAWTQPETLRRWFAPGEMHVGDVVFDARVGGRYRIAMMKPDGEPFVAVGCIREFRAPERLSMTWQWEDDDGKLEGNETILSLDFYDRDGDTELVLTHENFTDADSRGRHEHGWNAILDKLPSLIDGSLAPRRPLSIRGIDLSGYMVQDAPRAIAFYRDVLGLEPARIYPENRGAEYDLEDGTTFGLWGGGGKVMPFQPSNGILFAVDDLEAAVAALKARGIAVLMENETPVCNMAMIRDTEGNSVFLHRSKPPA
ncbi:MAG TPA: SRPBCC domain-containing protein [Candidatus Baltobacteraceae bacterium]|nr:SRPBCC domain-containing protein [Candidatus Baltobacteraceae bacterium]